MIEKFGFVHTADGWTHPDYPACVITLRMDYFEANRCSDSDKCMQFLRDKLTAELEITCAREIAALIKVGYGRDYKRAIFDQCFHTTVHHGIWFSTRAGPLIRIYYDWDRPRYVVAGYTGGATYTFEEIWDFLPPVYSAYLSCEQDRDDLVDQCRAFILAAKNAREELAAIYALGGIGAKAAGEHFKQIRQ
jgi:hypothetical protein